ncbi:cysteine dioxygenase [Brevibacillus reuszeri]|uniref:cysteine dioxygenase n=1 Tax=Brevibacillus reuszeri TaxID=54915 RepID=UPI002897AE46|nr:cysteine dioxygenase family protein [Brevibacillus reuszeri]
MNQEGLEKAFGSLHCPTAAEIRQTLESLSLCKDSIAEHIPEPDGLPYGRKVLVATPHVEVVLIHLPSDKESVPHNHGESFGWEWIISGTLTNIVYTSSAQVEDQVQQSQATIISEGECCYIAPGEIHSIRNNGETPVISLNVYTPPLRNSKQYPFAAM